MFIADQHSLDFDGGEFCYSGKYNCRFVGTRLSHFGNKKHKPPHISNAMIMFLGKLLKFSTLS